MRIWAITRRTITTRERFTRTSPATGLRVEDNDAGRTIFLQLFVAVSVASFGALSAVVESFEINVPAEAPLRQVLLVVHGHDPPFTRLRPARAPPANLS